MASSRSGARATVDEAATARADDPPPGRPSVLDDPGGLPGGIVVELLAMLGGAALIALPFLDTRLWLLAWLGLVTLFAVATRARDPRRAALDGLVMGFAVYVIGFHWIVTTITRFGGFPLPIALFFFSALSLYSALPFAIVAAAIRWAGPRAPVLLPALLWTAVEFVFPALFPWRLAHSQREVTILLQTGDLAGPFLLTFVMAYVASAIAYVASGIASRPRLRDLILPSVAVVTVLLYGAWRMPQVERAIADAPEFRVGVVQGNLLLDEKRHRSLFESNVARYRRLSASITPAPDLLIWPETVVEWGIPLETPSLRGLDPYPDAPAPLLFGAVAYRDYGRQMEWFNSAFLRRTDGSIGGRYDKIVLMPFGEFIPFASRFPYLKELSPNTGDFQAGAGPVVIPVDERARVGSLICYEDLLAGHVRATVVAGANLLAAVTNDAWFGDSAALHEHDTLALWRAVENRRYLVRATNTGLSTVTDPLGRTVASLPPHQATAAVVSIHLLEVTTPYQRIGDVFGWFTLALTVALLIWCRRR
jgi:apolipoprotein N-acyltransferase